MKVGSFLLLQEVLVIPCLKLHQGVLTGVVPLEFSSHLEVTQVESRCLSHLLGLDYYSFCVTKHLNDLIYGVNES